MMSARRRRVFLLAAVAALALSASAPVVGFADARSDYLVRLLRTSDSFRVRAQAALSLGQLASQDSANVDVSVLDALRDALRDQDAAVRVASASALARTGAVQVIPSLRPLLRDREAAVQVAAAAAIQSLEQAMRQAALARTVQPPRTQAEQPTAPARFYVGVGNPGSRVEISEADLARARGALERGLRTIPGILLAPDGERIDQANAVLRSRSLRGFYLDSSIVSIAPRADGALRAEVSVVVLTYPERNMRTFLTGGGAVLGATGAEARNQAIEAAYASALRNLETAFAASADEPEPRPTRRRRR